MSGRTPPASRPPAPAAAHVDVEQVDRRQFFVARLEVVSSRHPCGESAAQQAMRRGPASRCEEQDAGRRSGPRDQSLRRRVRDRSSPCEAEASAPRGSRLPVEWPSDARGAGWEWRPGCRMGTTAVTEPYGVMWRHRRGAGFVELVFEGDDAARGVDGGALIDQFSHPRGRPQLVAGVAAVPAGGALQGDQPGFAGSLEWCREYRRPGPWCRRGSARRRTTASHTRHPRRRRERRRAAVPPTAYLTGT